MTRKLVLLIDNDADSVNEIRNHLTRIGYSNESILVHTGLSPLAEIDPDDLDVILINYTSTFDRSFERMKDQFPTKPIVVLLDTSDESIIEKVLHAGAADYLLKGQCDARMMEKAILYSVNYEKFSTDYKRLFDENPGPMYIYDHLTYDFLGVNRAALVQYGYTRKEFLSMNARQIRPADTVHAFEQTNESRPDGYFDYGRWLHVRKNGEVFYVHIYAHTVEFENKLARLVFAVDIDNKVKAEMAIREKTAEIEKQNEQLDKIAWLNSHKVRGPVASILGLVQLFKIDTMTDPENAEIAMKLKEAADQLDQVINTIDFHASNKE